MSDTARVVSLGMLAGGSYGCPGNPSKVYEYFAVEGDGYEFPNFAHTNRQLVESRAVVVAEQRRKAREADAARDLQAEMRAAVGLPAHVLPNATFSSGNGSITIHVGGLEITGEFTLDANGTPVGPGVRKAKRYA